jgi:hypothetical protein
MPISSASRSELATMATASKAMTCLGNSNRRRQLRQRAWMAMAWDHGRRRQATLDASSTARVGLSTEPITSGVLKSLP